MDFQRLFDTIAVPQAEDSGRFMVAYLVFDANELDAWRDFAYRHVLCIRQVGRRWSEIEVRSRLRGVLPASLFRHIDIDILEYPTLASASATATTTPPMPPMPPPMPPIPPVLRRPPSWLICQT